jgi:hypothetical protein
MTGFPKAASAHVIRFPKAAKIENILLIFFILIAATFGNLFMWLLATF